CSTRPVTTSRRPSTPRWGSYERACERIIDTASPEAPTERQRGKAMTEHVIRRGEAAEGPFALVITPKTAGWGYSSLRILELDAGGSATFTTGEDEAVVLPLEGGCTVACDGQEFALTGRRGVFTRVTDFAYVPRDAE